MSESQIALRLAGGMNKTMLGAKEPIEVEGGNTWLHQGLFLHDTYQGILGAVKADADDKTLFTGNSPADRPGGWIAAEGVGGVFVCDRLFSANPARDRGKRHNWWRAINCQGEPAPGNPGSRERFVVSGVPAGKGPWHFALRGFDDDAGRRGPLSNVAVAKRGSASP